jgi:hypothetical protein
LSDAAVDERNGTEAEVVILGAGFLVLTTNDSTTRTVNILVCAVALLSVIVLAIDPAGRRRRAQDRSSPGGG